MKKRTMLIVVLVLMIALVAAVPAAAHIGGPCDNLAGEPGNSGYAKHHIAALATEGGLGNDAHKPGTHQGFSACDPSG